MPVTHRGLAALVVSSLALTSVVTGTSAAGAAAGGTSVHVTLGSDGRVTFLGSEARHALPASPGVTAATNPAAAADAFLGRNATMFGAEASTLAASRVTRTAGGGHAVLNQQRTGGLPVLGGELVVDLTGDNRVRSVTGELSRAAVDPHPVVPATAADATARGIVARDYSVTELDVVTDAPQLVVYDPTLLGVPGDGVAHLVWRVEASTRRAAEAVRQLVLVDAVTGGVDLQFNQVNNAVDRNVCTAVDDTTIITPEEYACPVVGKSRATSLRTEGAAPTGDNDVDMAYDLAGVTYDFYDKVLGDASPLGNVVKGVQSLNSTVHYCPAARGGGCPFENAAWDGTQMVYGDGYAAAADVVGHELTHGVTQHLSGLYYLYQSGAINESMSDVFGEIIDQWHTPSATPDPWLMGEATPRGALRSMANPTLYGDPDRMQSPLYGTSASGSYNFDSGNVHRNSGVGNKAAYLLATGGNFNGTNVRGIGNLKTARIYFEAQHLLTSGADYAALAVDLQQACRNLVGVAPTAAGGEPIVAADCDSTLAAVTATQMNLEPLKGGAKDAPICDGSLTARNVWSDGFENTRSTKWVRSSKAVWTYFADYAGQGRLAMSGDDSKPSSDTNVAMAKGVKVPPGASYLWFQQAFLLDSGPSPSGATLYYDGGVVEYSANGAAWRSAASLFVDNGYPVTIRPNGSSVGAFRGFGGDSRGYMASRLSLASLAGKSVRFRFRLRTDKRFYQQGWLIDDVRIYTCA